MSHVYISIGSIEGGWGALRITEAQEVALALCEKRGGVIMIGTRCACVATKCFPIGK